MYREFDGHMFMTDQLFLEIYDEVFIACLNKFYAFRNVGIDKTKFLKMHNHYKAHVIKLKAYEYSKKSFRFMFMLPNMPFGILKRHYRIAKDVKIDDEITVNGCPYTTQRVIAQEQNFGCFHNMLMLPRDVQYTQRQQVEIEYLGRAVADSDTPNSLGMSHNDHILIFSNVYHHEEWICL